MQANRPNIALRSLWAGTVVSFLAGPVFQWLLIATNAPEADSELPVRAGDIGFFFHYLFPIASVGGLVVAVPAATINALVVIALANKRIDGVFASVVSAAFWGAVIPAIALRLFGSETRNPIRGEHASSVITCLALTGALMGLVHWLIAVKPYRRWRLDADR